MRLTLFFGLFLAVARIWLGLNVEPDHVTWGQVYKDTAHLFMGGLFAFAWIQGHRWQWVLFWVLIAVEVAVAVMSRI